MGRLTGQLKSLRASRPGGRRRCSLRRAIDNALFLLEQRLQCSGIIARLNLPQEELHAWCDANRLEQVLVNLAGNALDAMEDQPAPALEIEALRQGERILVRVRDHGPGPSDEARAHLFEPFFTTKEAGSGLGPGLTISAGIVADSGGSLSGDNHPRGRRSFHDRPARRPGRMHHE